jgi:hypothetical protein
MKNSFKKILTVLTAFSLVVGGGLLKAQNPSQRPSPAATATGSIGKTDVTINYSQPGVKERKIWGELVPYGKVWRTGANEATTFEVSTDVMIEGKSLAAGKYALFTIPTENEWTFIFNGVANQSGMDYEKNKAKDALQVKVKPGKAPEFTERMTFSVDAKGMVNLTWENLQVGFTVKGK